MDTFPATDDGVGAIAHRVAAIVHCAPAIFHVANATPAPNSEPAVFNTVVDDHAGALPVRSGAVDDRYVPSDEDNAVIADRGAARDGCYGSDAHDNYLICDYMRPSAHRSAGIVHCALPTPG